MAGRTQLIIYELHYRALQVVVWVNCGVLLARKRDRTSRGAGCEPSSSRPPAVEGSPDVFFFRLYRRKCWPQWSFSAADLRLPNEKR